MKVSERVRFMSGYSMAIVCGGKSRRRVGSTEAALEVEWPWLAAMRFGGALAKREEHGLW